MKILLYQDQIFQTKVKNRPSGQRYYQKAAFLDDTMTWLQVFLPLKQPSRIIKLISPEEWRLSCISCTVY